MLTGSIAAIVTLGFGSYSVVGLLPTLGYGLGPYASVAFPGDTTFIKVGPSVSGIQRRQSSS